MKNWPWILLVTAVCLVVTCTASMADDMVTLTGRVKDADGKPIDVVVQPVGILLDSKTGSRSPMARLPSQCAGAGGLLYLRQDGFGRRARRHRSPSNTAPVLRVVIDNYLKGSGVNITPDHEADHLSMGMSLIASTRGVGLLPACAQNFPPSSVTSRPLKGDAPTIELVLGYKKSNESPILKLLLSRLDELVARVSKKTR